MQLRLGTLSLLATAGLLAGCGAGVRVSASVRRGQGYATPTGDAYHQALYGGYMEHATYEQEEMMNYTSAMTHSRNAMAAARGETPAVAGVTDFGPQPADKVDELTQARAQLGRPPWATTAPQTGARGGSAWRRPTMPAGSSSSTRTSSRRTSRTAATASTRT